MCDEVAPGPANPGEGGPMPPPADEDRPPAPNCLYCFSRAGLVVPLVRLLGPMGSDRWRCPTCGISQPAGAP